MTHPPLPMVFDFLAGGFVSPLEHVAVTVSAHQKQSVFVLLGLKKQKQTRGQCTWRKVKCSDLTTWYRYSSSCSLVPKQAITHSSWGQWCRLAGPFLVLISLSVMGYCGWTGHLGIPVCHVRAPLALLRPRAKVCLRVLASWASRVSGKDCNDVDHGKRPSLSYNTTKKKCKTQGECLCFML